ncbi:LytTR family transcriptional regulator DNA-binding domain-containing protein [Pedobacter sp. WC2501]|uniref:LytTR family transcriptional regulator DNA-binding domain-containing protein n=1 Tax=Pedobacter sp. WC2501 TaxID=3461400 RepID=UPI0040459753
MKHLDGKIFYLANRQFIISHNAIKTIYNDGKNQLKIVVSPEPDEVILISKTRCRNLKNGLTGNLLVKKHINLTDL